MTRRSALITGASGGIGHAIARRLASTHLLILASSNPGNLSEAVESIKAACPTAEVIQVVMDVSDDASVGRGVRTALSACGQIDVLVNCAGVANGGRTIEFPVSEWNRIIAVNLSGTFLVTTMVLRAAGMLERKWGRIINIASTGGKQGVMFGAAYSASKHGVVGFTKSLGLELASTGVTVNAICPGFVETPMAEHTLVRYASVWQCSTHEAKRRIEARIPLGRYVVPEEVAGLAAYLASDESGAVLAQAFNVCGGLGTY